MRVRTLAMALLALGSGACTDVADPSSIFNPATDHAPPTLARARTYYGALAADPNRKELGVGDSVQITTRPTAFGGRAVVPEFIGFTSRNPSVATVDSSGLVKGVAPGRTVVFVYATSRNIKFSSDSVWIHVGGTTSDGTPDGAGDAVTGPAAEEEPAPDTVLTSGPTTVPDTTAAQPAPAPPDTTSTAPPPLPPPPPPAPIQVPPPAGIASRPHEPSGYTLITDRQFDSKAGTNDDRGSNGSDGWDGVEYKFWKFTVAKDPSAPNGDGVVGQMYYPADHLAGTGPATAQVYFPPSLRQVYVSVWAKISSNWVGNQASVNKMFFLGVAGGNNQFVFNAGGAGLNPLRPELKLQGVYDTRRMTPPNVNNVAIVRGQWQQWEFVFTCNSAPQVPDGTMDLWIDGVHVTTMKNVNWTQTAHPTRDCNMNMFNWNPTYGGGGASPGADQYLWFDRVYISGK